MTQENWEKDVLDFWFDELEAEQWFKKDEALDKTIVERFGALHTKIAEMPVADLARTPRRALAAIIVLDQFSRNMFRGSAKSFASDAKARDLAATVIAAGDDADMTVNERHFLYMPYMHSETLDDQDRSCDLFRKLGKENGITYAEKHRDVIKQFGRFPHRNDVLGRETTGEEQRWLDDGGGF
ncbi:DUF924 family protein [Oricola cellulosilytica]|uniref:DUF924 domain-containing protein n=1 Tax=Oricola cellulosilytica TaxID=1429082 RepID=A0A4R0PI28_9HYPH|nr:DUF924 family protein [Oricola cellulosilytica]TCD16453.1 DUF924 domain-containing protein [Oricola cellulosilytica]